MSQPALSAGLNVFSVAAPVLYLLRICLFALSVLGASASAADIHRCTLPDGSVVFQDQKCRAGTSQVLRGKGSSGSISESRLRQWLDDQPKKKVMPETRSAPARSFPRTISPLALPQRPASEHLLAMCSEQVLSCAGTGALAMDKCIADIARCGGQTTQSCCAEPFVERYQQLRRAQVEQRDAVRGALLGVEGESGSR